MISNSSHVQGQGGAGPAPAAVAVVQGGAEQGQQPVAFNWKNRSAKEWSKKRLLELLVKETDKYETPAGTIKITEMTKCDGDATMTRGPGMSTEYHWHIKLKWKGTPREADNVAITGSMEIDNFRSNSQLPEVSFEIHADSERPEAEKLINSFRTVVFPRIRGALDKYVYFLLDMLRMPTTAASPARPHLSNKFNKPHVWLKTSQTENMDGENEPPSSQPPANIDVFQEREGAGGMRVGRDFQAKVPPMLTHDERQSPQENAERALLVWAPSEQLSDEDIETYLGLSRDKYQYSGEQALGLLFWHRYDIDKALNDLGNFTPHPEEWTLEDKVLFEQAFQFHGKAFDKIRQMLPDKSMSNLIRYYYKWKKLKNKTSVMDRQAKKFNQDDLEEVMGFGGSHNNNNGHYSVLDIQSFRPQVNYSDVENDERVEGSDEQLCANCGIPCTGMTVTEHMCNTCFAFYKKTGQHRPLAGPLKPGDKQSEASRQRKHPPKGMYISHDDLKKLAASTPQAENITLKELEKRVLDDKFRVQELKQSIEMLKRQLPETGMQKYKEFLGIASPQSSSVVPSSSSSSTTPTPHSSASSQAKPRNALDFGPD